MSENLMQRIKSETSLELFRLDGLIALVTGAAGHLGKSLAAGLAEAGAQVILSGRTPATLEEVKVVLESKGYRVDAVPLNVTQRESVEEAFESVRQRYGKLNILVNNAYAGSSGTLRTATEQEFARSYDVAVIGAFRCMKVGFPLLQKAAELDGYASVINIASMYGLVSPDLQIYTSEERSNPPFYGSAKAALLQLTRYAACEYARWNIRVNAISPGPFPAPAVREREPEFYRRLCEKVPLRRTGEPEELKGAVLFLASKASSFVTGCNLVVDGGWTAW